MSHVTDESVLYEIENSKKCWGKRNKQTSVWVELT